MAKKLYQFHWDCGRSGDLEGLFIAEEKDVKDAIGKEIAFGEVLGKHSWVDGTLDEIDLSEVNIPENVVLILEDKVGRTISGYNPLEYLEGEDW